MQGDTVIIAGATGRVGGATLGTLVERGAMVGVVSRSIERAADAIARNGDSKRCLPLAADLLREGDVHRIMDEVVAWNGRIDAVISLAGGGSPFTPIVESTLDDLETSVRNNLIVAYNLFVPALRRVLKQTPRPGNRTRARFVAVTAGSSLDPQPRFGIMGAGKAGVNLLMRAIAREHKGDGIVANAVVLGTVATEAAREYLSPSDFAAAAQPSEVAQILAFHASDASSGVNGELIHLNAREVD